MSEVKPMSEEIFDEYDRVIGYTLNKIIERCDGQAVVKVWHLDTKSETGLFIVEMLKLLTIAGYEIRVICSRHDYRKYIKGKYNFERLGDKEDTRPSFDTMYLLEDIIKEHNLNINIFAEIYREYYYVDKKEAKKMRKAYEKEQGISKWHNIKVKLSLFKNKIFNINKKVDEKINQGEYYA